MSDLGIPPEMVPSRSGARFVEALRRLSSEGWLRAYEQWSSLDAVPAIHRRWMIACQLVWQTADRLGRTDEWDEVGTIAFGLAFDGAMGALGRPDGASGQATDFAMWVWSAASAAALSGQVTEDIIDVSHAPFAGVLAPPVAGVVGTSLPAEARL